MKGNNERKDPCLKQLLLAYTANLAHHRDLNKHVGFKSASEARHWFWKVICDPPLVILKVIKMFLGTTPVLFHTVHLISANKATAKIK